jgi:hypothetical protein
MRKQQNHNYETTTTKLQYCNNQHINIIKATEKLNHYATTITTKKQQLNHNNAMTNITTTIIMTTKPQ